LKLLFNIESHHCMPNCAVTTLVPLLVVN